MSDRSLASLITLRVMGFFGARWNVWNWEQDIKVSIRRISFLGPFRFFSISISGINS